MSVPARRRTLFTILALLVPVLAQAQKLRQPIVLAVPPQGVTASPAATGVQISWQVADGATQYLVMRGASSTTLTQLAAVPAGTGSYLDQGFNAPASYQVVAVFSTGKKAASEVVAYAPPAKMMALPKGPIATLAPTGIKNTTLANRLPSGTPPVITSLDQPPAGAAFARNGSELVVTGTGLDGLTGVALQDAYNAGGRWLINRNASPMPVTLTKASATSIAFVPSVPNAYSLTNGNPYVVIVTKGAWADTSDAAISIAAPMPVRKITSVARAVIRSGGRVQVTGAGFDQVIGGYFGPGVPNSVTNPMFSVMNRSATYVELVTTATCSQEGLLMLKQTQVQGESELILPDQPVTVACVSGTPSGTIVGSEGSATGTVNALPGSKVTIRGSNLKYVTRVVDQSNTAYPFTYLKVGAFDQLSVQLPGPRPDGGEFGMGFLLENVLLEPQMAGSVTGSVTVMGAPTFIRAEPAWAEPGQLVYVVGHQLKYNAPPQVWVGGVPAQVVSVSPTATTLAIRLGAGTTAGPIEVQNEVGKRALTGPFQAQTGAQHPGFFVVSGPSVVTQVSAPRPTLAYGDVLTVTGQNLARLGGICVKSSGQGGVPAAGTYLPLRRAEYSGSAQMGSIASNTVMQVTFEYQPYGVAPGPVQLYQSPNPPGDMPPTAFACTPTANPVSWPAP